MPFNRVLITGGTGSFGQAFTRTLLEQHAPEAVCIYSRGEHAQAQMRETFGNDERLRFFVGDVRDLNRLCRAMEGCDLVVHAAALKRVEVGEYCPDEMVRTNIGGALNVIDAAMSAGVQRVVALSTDKACAPLNAYGASKLMAEKLFLAANNIRGENPPHFAVTRYGNVSGSNGSVIPLWRSLLAAGETAVPVTHPDMTRFWMTLAEAVQLVIWTAQNMEGGELVVPDLPAYRVADLAKAMGAEMKVVGLRPGEKMAEAMISPDEAFGFSSLGRYYVRGGPIRAGMGWRVIEGLSSDKARRMSVDELKEGLRHV